MLSVGFNALWRLVLASSAVLFIFILFLFENSGWGIISQGYNINHALLPEDAAANTTLGVSRPRMTMGRLLTMTIVREDSCAVPPPKLAYPRPRGRC